MRTSANGVYEGMICARKHNLCGARLAVDDPGRRWIAASDRGLAMQNAPRRYPTKQLCLPGPELVLLPAEDGSWLWSVASDSPLLTSEVCTNLQVEAARYRARLLDRN